MKEGREILKNIDGEIEMHKREKREKQASIQQLQLTNQHMRKQLNNTKIALHNTNSQCKQVFNLIARYTT